jgi:hypothetical protein
MSKPVAAPLRLPELPQVKPVTGVRPQVSSGVLNGAAPELGAAKPVTGSRPQVAPGAGADAASGRPVTGSRPQISAPQLNGVGPSPELPAVRPLTGARPVVTAPSLAGATERPVTGSVPVARPITTGTNPMLRAPGTAAPPRPAPAPIGTQDGLSDSKIKAIYEAYVMAKKRCGEDTRSLTLDSVSSSLKKQVPELMKQHNARSVEFKVVIKDGKAVLRALPKDT